MLDIATSIAVGVERYQTLLAALLAIIAAKIAVRPVWAQVIATNTQTQIAHLETLHKLLNEAVLRSEQVQKSFSEPLRQMNRTLYDPRGDEVEIDGQTAHFLGRQTSDALDWYLVTLAATESAKVEDAKSELKTALDEFNRTLGIIEWVEFNDQSGEDYSYNDEEWDALLENVRVASKEASTKGSEVSRAYHALITARGEMIRHLRGQIGAIEKALAKLS